MENDQSATQRNTPDDVDWAGIITPGNLLLTLIATVQPILAQAIRHGKEILKGKAGHENVPAFLALAGTASTFFWVSASRRDRLGKRFPNRDKDMRAIAGISGSRPQSLTLVRNDFIHVDERLEEFYLDSPEANLISWQTVRSDGNRRHFMTQSEDGRSLYSLQGVIDVPEVIMWLERTYGSISKNFLYLAVNSHAIGDAE